MKKFKELSYRIQALIIVLVVLFFIFVVPFIFFFVSYMDSSVENFHYLTKVQFPKRYETRMLDQQLNNPFAKAEIVEWEDDQDGRWMSYRLVRIQFLSDKEAANFDEELQTAKEWHSISDLSSDEIEILENWFDCPPNGYFVANSRPLDSGDLRFILYHPDTREIIYLFLD